MGHLPTHHTINKMMRLTLVCCLAAVAIAAPFNTELDDHWDTYKKSYNKVYDEMQEVIRPLATFRYPKRSTGVMRATSPPSKTRDSVAPAGRSQPPDPSKASTSRRQANLSLFLSRIL